MSRSSFLNDLKNYWPLITGIAAIVITLSGNVWKVNHIENRINAAPPEVVVTEVKHLQKDVDQLRKGQEEIQKDIKTLLSRK